MRLAWVLVLGVGLGLPRRCGDASGSGTEHRDRTISFRRDVAPILVTSCSTRSCHGGACPPELVAGEPSKMRVALVGVSSEQRPDRAYVKPGDPAASYLVDKLAGALSNAQCVHGDCGRPMPSRSPPLPESAQAMIRSWIADGAKDN